MPEREDNSDPALVIQVEENIGSPALIDRCLSGDIVLVSGFLQKAGAYRPVRRAVLSAVEAVNGNAAKQIEASGFENLHDLMSIEECIQAVKLAEKRLSRAAPGLYRKLLGPGLGYRGPVWVLKRPIVRFHVPHDRTATHRRTVEQFRTEHGEGRMTPLRPHRDNWFKEPLTCINVWIALGTVAPGNGLSIFPSDYANVLSYETKHGVTLDQAVTRPVNPSMSEGDALFFHGSHLHASEINHSDLTRAVVSMRFAVEHPGMNTPPAGRYCRVDSRQPSSLWLLHPNGTIRRCAHFLRRIPATGACTSPSLPRLGRLLESPRAVPPGIDSPGCNRVTVGELSVGRPKAISEHHLLVKLEQRGEQQVWRLNRRCPHEGADLALGHVEGHHIRCPWHNLPIDITTGRSACTSFRSLDARLCGVRNGEVELG